MNNNINKRKTRNSNMVNSSVNHGSHNMVSKSSRGKNSPGDKSMSQAEGVYFNGRLMHAATSLIGSIVQVVVKGGNTYEGVLRTFSPEFELVVDMVVEIDPNAVNGGSNIGGLLESLANKREVQSTMIFKLQDVIMLNLLNVDLDYASRGHFTDAEISRFDGQSLNKSKDLVPWEGPPENDGCSLEEDGTKNAQNGWDPDAMFKLNEEKYNLSSTYDSSLQGYTVPLEAKDTADYKQKEAQAAKIAQDIESGPAYKERISKEDGDEEERYSAVVRPTNDATHAGGHGMRRRKSQNSNSSIASGPSGGRPKGPPSSSPLISSPTSLGAKFQHQQQPPAPPPQSVQPAQPPPQQQQTTTQCQPQTQPHPPPQQHHHHHQQQHPASYPAKSSNVPLQQKNPCKEDTGGKVGSTTSSSNYPKTESDDYSNQLSSIMQPPLPQRNNVERRAAIPKKREDVSSDLKKFSNDFKFASDAKDSHMKDNSAKEGAAKAEHVSTEKTDAKEKESKVNSNVEVGKELRCSHETDSESNVEKVVKKSTLNPNAKEFNPSAKPFAPRAPTYSGPGTPNTIAVAGVPNQHQHQQGHQSHQPRMQNPVLTFPPQFMAPLQYQYMLTPNMAMAPTFQNNNNQQTLRFRNKGPQQYQNQNNRHDYSQASAQVAAATGHPVLASAPIPGPTQIPVAYTSQPQAPTSGPPQAVAYSPIYPVHAHRMNMVGPQMQVVQHVSYGDPNLQHFYMNVGPVPLASHLVPAVAAQQSVANSGQHTAPSTPQSGQPSTPLHAAPPTPSPVHHQTAGVPNQPPTPTPGLMYSSMAPPPPQQHGGQTPVSAATHSSNCTPHYVNQQMVPLILPTGQGLTHAQHPGQGHAGHVHPGISHSNSAANHHGASSSQAPLMSAVPVTIPVIPTSATIVATPGAIQPHFAPNTQSRI